MDLRQLTPDLSVSPQIQPSEVEELARHDPALDPPLVAVGENLWVRRRRGEDGRPDPGTLFVRVEAAFALDHRAGAAEHLGAGGDSGGALRVRPGAGLIGVWEGMVNGELVAADVAVVLPPQAVRAPAEATPRPANRTWRRVSVVMATSLSVPDEAPGRGWSRSGQDPTVGSASTNLAPWPEPSLWAVRSPP